MRVFKAQVGALVGVLALASAGCSQASVGETPPKVASSADHRFIAPKHLIYSSNSWPAPLSIVTHDLAASGDALPLATIAGPHTGFQFDVGGLAVDSRAAKVMKFEAGAHGNVAPTRVIAGPATGITGPVGIALSGTGDVWVSNVSFVPPAKIYGFHSNDNGNVAPSQTIAASPDNYFVNGGPAYLNGRIVFPGVGQGSEVVLDTYSASISGPPTLLRAIYGPDTGLASGEFVAVH